MTLRAAFLVALLAACAGGQKTPSDPLVEARHLLAAAQSEYAAGNFGKSADLFEQVYRLKPVPELLFNEGQAARLAHDYRRAERAFRDFLRLGDPPPGVRDRVERAVSQIQAALAGASDPLVAVLELRGIPLEKGRGGQPTPDSMYLTNLIRGLAADRGLNVMTRENVEVLLTSRSASMADCVDKCEIEIGRILGADYVISGELLRTSDSRYRASVQLHESRSARFLGGAQATGADVSEVEAGLRREMAGLLDRLLSYAAEPRP